VIEILNLPLISPGSSAIEDDPQQLLSVTRSFPTTIIPIADNLE
jgi:hypothetical protein